MKFSFLSFKHGGCIRGGLNAVQLDFDGGWF